MYSNNHGFTIISESELVVVPSYAIIVDVKGGCRNKLDSPKAGRKRFCSGCTGGCECRIARLKIDTSLFTSISPLLILTSFISHPWQHPLT